MRFSGLSDDGSFDYNEYAIAMVEQCASLSF
jgi:hypothetical protein